MQPRLTVIALGVEDPGGWGGVTLAHNVGSLEEVDRVIARAEAAGATIPRHGGRP